MEFTDIAMELSKKFAGFLSSPFVLQLQEGNLDPVILRIFNLGCLLPEVFFQKLITSWLIRLQTKR